jgi:hypothetical protein
MDSFWGDRVGLVLKLLPGRSCTEEWKEKVDFLHTRQMPGDTIASAACEESDSKRGPIWDLCLPLSREHGTKNSSAPESNILLVHNRFVPCTNSSCCLKLQHWIEKLRFIVEL